MSVRAISQATKMSVGTVHQAAAGVQNRTPEQGSNVVGLDGKSYSAPKRKQGGDDDKGFGGLSLTDLGVQPIDRSKLRQASTSTAPARESDEALSGDVVDPAGDGADQAESWWEGPRAALVEAEARCVALLEQRKRQPRLVEDPQDQGPSQLTMTAARTVLAAGGVIVNLGVDDLDRESQDALRRVLGTVIESLDGVIGDLEEADDDEA